MLGLHINRRLIVSRSRQINVTIPKDAVPLLEDFTDKCKNLNLSRSEVLLILMANWCAIDSTSTEKPAALTPKSRVALKPRDPLREALTEGCPAPDPFEPCDPDAQLPEWMQ